MSWSKIYKNEECQSLQMLRFVDFSSDGGGVVPGEPLFHNQAIPASVTGGAAAVGGLALEAKIEEAYLLGKREGAEKVEKRFGETIKAFSAALEDLSQLRESILKNSADDMLRLVLAMVEQIIPCAVSLNPEIIHHTIVKALQASVDSDVYHVKVHPDDLAMVMEKKPLMLASISGLKNITVEPDQSISRGGCLVESELGEVDATIESQLDEIRAKIINAAGGS
jgi:flagellar assembly protein FliH